jgi:hypothetical protein
MVPESPWWWRQHTAQKRWSTEVDQLHMTLSMEAVGASETSVYLNDTTRRYIPENFHLHTRCRENLEYHSRYVKLTDNEGLLNC